METVYVRVPRAKVHEILAEIPKAILKGGYLSDAMMAKTGRAVQQVVRDAFVVKSRGGTDAAGERWRKLSPKTVAYKRKHAGLPAAHIRAAFRPSYALSPAQRGVWWVIYRRMLAKFDGDKAHAAAIAWSALKSKGVLTLLDRYGGLKVDILPGVGNSFIEHGDHEVFRVHNGTATIGTTHRARLGKRRLWAKPASWPSQWNMSILREAREGLLDVIVDMVKNA